MDINSVVQLAHQYAAAHPGCSLGSGFVLGLATGPKAWDWFITKAFPWLVIKALTWLKARGMTVEQEKKLDELFEEADKLIDADVAARTPAAPPAGPPA